MGVIADRLYVFSMYTAWPPSMTRGLDKRAWKQFGYIALSPDGRARDGRVNLLRRPIARDLATVTAAVICGGRLCVGTQDSGLLIYHPASGKWIVLGPGQGLPERRVAQLLPLEGQRLLCYTHGKGGFAAVTVDVVGGTVTGQHRPEPRRRFPWRIWRAGGRWVGVSLQGVDHDVLGPWRLTPWPQRTQQGWQRRRAGPGVHRIWYPHRVFLARVGERRFVDLPDALRELDGRGRIVRTWTKQFGTGLDPLILEHSVSSGWFAVIVPGVLPLGYVVACDETALIYDSPHGLLCFDPAADRWYGPVRIEGVRQMSRQSFRMSGTRAGMAAGGRFWLAGTPMASVRVADLIRTAQEARLVATSADLAERLARAARDAPPMDRAKFALGQRRLEDARRILAQVLREDPDNPEPVLLTGLVHDRVCLNRPDVALDYYRQLTEMTDRRNAVVSGLELQCRWHVLAGDLGKALEISRKGAALPRLGINIRGHFRYLGRAIAKEIAARKEKTAMSNNE